MRVTFGRWRNRRSLSPRSPPVPTYPWNAASLQPHGTEAASQSSQWTVCGNGHRFEVLFGCCVVKKWECFFLLVVVGVVGLIVGCCVGNGRFRVVRRHRPKRPFVRCGEWGRTLRPIFILLLRTFLSRRFASTCWLVERPYLPSIFMFRVNYNNIMKSTRYIRISARARTRTLNIFINNDVALIANLINFEATNKICRI